MFVCFCRHAQAEAMPYVKRQLEFLWDGNFVRVVFFDLLALPSLHSEDATPTLVEEKPKSKIKCMFRYDYALMLLLQSCI